MEFNNPNFHQLAGNGSNFKNSHWRSQLLTFLVIASGPMFEVGTTLSSSPSKGPMFYKMSKVGTASGYF
ncbi:hypothetical protein Hanom_Chr11g00995801 [Helianthus anomalus]